jgi:hypothetical protein
MKVANKNNLENNFSTKRYCLLALTSFNKFKKIRLVFCFQVFDMKISVCPLH